MKANPREIRFGKVPALYSPSSQISMNEVQVLQIPHARRDLRRHVDETVETETTTKWREFPATKLRYSHSNTPDRRRLGGIPPRCRSTENQGLRQGCASLTINKRVKLSRERNLLRVNFSDGNSLEMKPSSGSLETIAALRES